ncbi:MAG: TetR/AcrR family transcriptional regulator, partial [Pseudomonadales bacterium]|nr:TetR/AcrR family transcriptional regulator [Pseudomonadales bacterium]
MVEENSIATPRRRNTKERIIDEAEKLASIHGIEHLKLQDVADKIGIKLPSVYAHFSGREDILAAMGSRINRAFTQMFQPKAGEASKESLRRSAVELAEFLGTNPAYFRLMLRDLSVPLGYDPLN